MKTLLTLIALLTWAAIPSPACINSLSGVTLDGRRARYRPALSVYELKRSRGQDLSLEGAELEERFRGETEFTNRTDYAIGLIYLGDYAEAIAVLQSLEKERPGEYSTAANLGTAYELSGKNPLALQWIQEGVKRNPASHEGSEWVHVELLRAKIAQEKEAKYFDTHSVLNLDLKALSTGAKTATIAGKERGLEEIRDAVHYQLRERLKFVKSNDVVVASLLVDEGVLEAATRTVQSGRQLLQLAGEYGYPQAQLRPFYAQFDHAVHVANVRRMFFWGTIGFGVVGFLTYAVKRRWIRVR
jgi:tetratricopeptide (TPR) repeat protein